MKILICAFQPFLNSPQNSEYFEYRHIGSNKKISPCRMPKAKSPAPLAPTKPSVLYNHFGVCRGGGGGTPPPWGSGPDQDRPPWAGGSHRAVRISLLQSGSLRTAIDGFPLERVER